MLIETDNKLYHLIRAIRPRQWIKNGAVYAPIVFSGQLFDPYAFYKATLAFIYFSITASAIYLINDVFDVKKDRIHPIKKNRPIASGKISIKFATTLAILMLFFAIPTSFVVVGKYFGVILLSYLGLQILYNLWLKNAIILDAITISLGFILRVFGGALAIPVAISSWLILAIIGVSLLLAFGKRLAERTLLRANNINDLKTREILSHYPDSLLDSMISVSATLAILSYSLLSFQVSPEHPVRGILAEYLPSTLVGAKFLMLTIPIVIYWVARYLYVIYEKKEGESPERILLQDKPLLLSTLILAIAVIFITNLF